jgi:hypothetical protein
VYAESNVYPITELAGKPPKPVKKRSKSPKKAAKTPEGAEGTASDPAAGPGEPKKLQHGESTKGSGKASPQMSVPASGVPSPRPQPLTKEKVNKDILQRIKVGMGISQQWASHSSARGACIDVILLLFNV